MHKRILFLVGVAPFIFGCTQQQVAIATKDVATVQAELNKGCAVYASTVATVNALGVGLVPQAQVIEGFGSGACLGATATADLVSKALSDPNTVAWLNNLSVMLKNIHV